MDRREYLDLVRRASDVFFRTPGVFAVGLGSKWTAGRNTGRLSIGIMVREKKPPSALESGEVIPAEFEGIPTDVVEGEPPRPIQDDEEDFDPGVPADTDMYRPIVGGIRIRGARSQTQDREPTFGTLGCFATTTGKDAGKHVLLTNHHVLADLDGNLHGPSCTGCTKGDQVGNPNSGSGIATVLRGRNDDQIDAAIAILDEGVQFQRDVIRDDVPGERVAVAGTRVLDPTVDTDRDFTAHKRGHRTRLTFGTVGLVGAEVVIQGNRKENQIRIDLPIRISEVVNATFQATGTVGVPAVDFLAEGVQVNDVAWFEGPSPNAGQYRITTIRQHELVLAATFEAGTENIAMFVTAPLFSLHGDSGSVVLDDTEHVIGLLWAARTGARFGNAWANAIDVVEERLRIRIDTAGTVGDIQTAGSAERATDPAIAIGRPIVPIPAPVPAGGGEPTFRERVEAELLPLPRGRLYHALYFRHHTEIRELLDAEERVATVWHRQGGPAILQSLLDVARSSGGALPSTVRGRSWADRVHAILAVFAEYGSESLRDDVARFGDEVAAYGGMTYERLRTALGA